MQIRSIICAFALLCPPAFAAGTHDHGHAYSVCAPSSDEPDRVFSVSMRDTMRFVFDPEFTELHAGEVIRSDVSNDGAILHEFSIGNAAEQVEHAKMMRKMPNMKHEDPNTVSLPPGASASLTWRFEGKDSVVFACNIPGLSRPACSTISPSSIRRILIDPRSASNPRPPRTGPRRHARDIDRAQSAAMRTRFNASRETTIRPVAWINDRQGL